MAKQLRSDITGLRAIAVVSVTIYHLVHILLPQVTWFKGGFLGVDIFFVISGYLMTMIIMKGLENNTFSLVDFYRRRAKRICPSLLVTVLVFVGFGYLLIGSSDLKRMSYEGFYALLFVSNIYFSAKTDYFANAALDQAFLHTWSLSVEWQFYLFYPLILIAFKHFLRNSNALGRLILILTIASVFFGAWYTQYSPKSSYYLLPARAFELLAGGLAYFYSLKNLKLWAQAIQDALAQKVKDQGNDENFYEDKLTITKLCWYHKILFLVVKLSPRTWEITGIVIILFSMMIIDDTHGWPTLWAVLPIFGTWLCIAGYNQKSVLRFGVFQKLGLWSYAIYLVHWPLLVFVTKLGFYAWSLELLIPIVLLGVLLHYTVERRRNYGYLFLAVYCALGAGTFALAYTDGANFRLNQKSVSKYAQYGGHTVPFEGTVNAIGDLNRKPDFILIGDSFARHYTLDLIDRGLHVITVFRDGCYSFADHVNRRAEGYVDQKCKGRYDEALKAISQYPDLPIVFAQDWPRYQNALVTREGEEAVLEDDFYQAIADDLQKLSAALGPRKAYILGTPMQTVYDIGSTCMYLHALDNPFSRFMRVHFTCIERKNLQSIPFNSFLKDYLLKIHNLIYIDPNSALCFNNQCDVLVDSFIPVYQDGLHYSWAGSVKVVSYILTLIGVDQGKVRTDFSKESE